MTPTNNYYSEKSLMVPVIFTEKCMLTHQRHSFIQMFYSNMLLNKVFYSNMLLNKGLLDKGFLFKDVIEQMIFY
jgi:hypothetical protein